VSVPMARWINLTGNLYLAFLQVHTRLEGHSQECQSAFGTDRSGPLYSILAGVLLETQ
jgi:hypothetical protein